MRERRSYIKVNILSLKHQTDGCKFHDVTKILYLQNTHQVYEFTVGSSVQSHKADRREVHFYTVHVSIVNNIFQLKNYDYELTVW